MKPQSRQLKSYYKYKDDPEYKRKKSEYNRKRYREYKESLKKQKQAV